MFSIPLFASTCDRQFADYALEASGVNRRRRSAGRSAEIYTPSARPYEPPHDPDYPFHDRTVRVTRCGRICLGSQKIKLSTAPAEQLVGIREVDDQVWQVSFLEYELGYFDRDQDRVEPGPNPFAPDTVLTMRPAYTHIESFNSRLRDECLNVMQFMSIEDARATIEGVDHRWARMVRARNLGNVDRLRREAARDDLPFAV